MNVSRTAHEPANCAPLTGSCAIYVSLVPRGKPGSHDSPYRNDENASQSRTCDDEDSTTEQDHQAHLLEWLEASFPEHW
jgi:hypothetical protein